jgi:hypothetical protein
LSQSQVVSFRASGHFLNWIEAQRLEDESVNQAAQRILKELSGRSTKSVYKVSTPDSPSFVSTDSSTIVETVDKLVTTSIEPVLERMAAIEKRLGKLSA